MVTNMTLPELQKEKERIENEIKDLLDRELIPLLNEYNCECSVRISLDSVTTMGGDKIYGTNVKINLGV